MNFVRAIQSTARVASQSHSSGSDKLETIARAHRQTRLLLLTGLTDAKINRRYLVRYIGDVLAYSHSDRFGPLRVLSCCYYY